MNLTIIYSIGLIIFTINHLSDSATTTGKCVKDANCGKGAACVLFKLDRTEHRMCAASSKSTPACGGRSFGHCPPQTNATGPLMCLFIKTTKLRNVECCRGVKKITSTPTGGSTTAETESPTAGSVSSTSSTSGAARFLSEVAADPDTCMECFADPNDKKKTIAGTYNCVPLSSCKQKSTFPATCEVHKTCETKKNELCNGHGTCAPSDVDDPENSLKCICQPGFGGQLCDKVVSSACVSSCGIGGTCTKGVCKCKTGFTGKQCLKCKSDVACNSKKKAGTCNKKTGVCKCKAGFEGDAYCNKQGGTLDPCDSMDCGTNGSCIEGQCVCIRDCQGNSCRACSTDNCADCSSAQSNHKLGLSTFLAILFTICTYIYQ